MRIPTLSPGLRGPVGDGAGGHGRLAECLWPGLGLSGARWVKGAEKAHATPEPSGGRAASPPQSPKLNISASFSFQKAKLRSM